MECETPTGISNDIKNTHTHPTCYYVKWTTGCWSWTSHPQFKLQWVIQCLCPWQTCTVHETNLKPTCLVRLSYLPNFLTLPSCLTLSVENSATEVTNITKLNMYQTCKHSTNARCTMYASLDINVGQGWKWSPNQSNINYLSDAQHVCIDKFSNHYLVWV